MTVSVEKLEGLKRKVVLSLLWDEIRVETAKQLKLKQKKARVNGFRPGKAPLSIVESMYGADIQEDILNRLAWVKFNQSAQELNLRVAGLQRLSALDEQKDDTQLMVEAVFEVYPDVVLPDLSAQSVERVVCTVNDADVAKTLEVLRKQRSTFNITEEAAASGDRVTVDFLGKIDGEEFAGGSAKAFSFVLGEGKMLPEFESGITGMKAGEAKDVPVNFPEDYHGKEVAGKTAIFTITVHLVEAAQLPDVDEAFARALGQDDGNVDSMKLDIRKNLEREIKRRTQEFTRRNVFEVLMNQVELDIPENLLKNAVEKEREEFQRNVPNAKGADIPDSIFESKARNDVKLGLILSHIIEVQKTNATTDEISAYIAEIAENYQDKQEVIDFYGKNAEARGNIAALIAENKAVEWVLQNAKTSDKPLAFDDLMSTSHL